MAEDDGVLQQWQQSRELFGKSRLSRHHRLADAGQGGDAGADLALGVDELVVLRHDPPALDAADADLDHPVTEIGAGAGGFDVDERQGRVAETLDEGDRHPCATKRPEPALPWDNAAPPPPGVAPNGPHSIYVRKK